MNLHEDLLDNEQTAAILGIKPNTLEIWRGKGRGPEFVKMGDVAQAPVRYRRSAINDWLARQSFASTSAYSAAARSTPTRLVPSPAPGSI
jgi:predicted DNA-binding transcriptional regulator AlpA